MKKRLLCVFLILCMIIPLIPAGSFAAASDHPIKMTAEADPDCEMTGPGTLSYVRFVIKNTGDEEYTLFNPTLSSDVLDDECALYFEGGKGGEAGSVTLEPGTVKEFRIYDVYLPESALNTDIRFTLTWDEAVFTYPEEDPWEPEEDDGVPWEEEDSEEDPDWDPEPEEGEPDEPWGDVPQRVTVNRTNAEVTYVKRKVSATVFVETAETPTMQISVKADSGLVRTDGTVTVTIVLNNATKYDFEDITLTDPATGEIELEETTLRADESMTVRYTFTMGRENTVICPEATYTVRGKMCHAKCTKPYTVEYMYDSLTLDVEQYTPTEEGTLFSLTVTNKGTHRMRDIRLEDDTGTLLCQPFSLDPGQSRNVTHIYGSYTGLSENRRVTFTIRATDSEGEEYLYQKPGSFEIRPYVGSGQVSLLMNVTLTSYDEETNTVKLLFEIRNYSDVAISNAVITETDVLAAPVRSYPYLTKGETTFTMDFVLGEGVSVLTFHMDADDAGGTHYATEPVSLHVDQLALSVKNGTFGSAANTVIDTSGTVFDTDKYRSYIINGLLALLLAAVVMVLISGMFRGAEKLVRKDIPEHDPVSRITGAGTEVQDTARMRFGYMKPAKLRYAQGDGDPSDTDTNRHKKPSENEESTQTGGAHRSDTRPEKNTGTYVKPKKQVQMLTQSQTIVFDAPVTPKRGKAAFITDYPKKKQEKPKFVLRKPAVRETDPEREAPAVPVAPETNIKAPEKRLTMSECLAKGKPYSFDPEPVPAVIPAPAEPEIVFITAPSLPPA